MIAKLGIALTTPHSKDQTQTPHMTETTNNNKITALERTADDAQGMGDLNIYRVVQVLSIFTNC